MTPPVETPAQRRAKLRALARERTAELRRLERAVAERRAEPGRAEDEGDGVEA